jgi:hypothetical protein
MHIYNLAYPLSSIRRCIFPLICNRIFEVFSCEKFDNGKRLLRADYSIDCASEKHKDFEVLAAIMIVVYPIGVLVLFYCALAPYAAELSDVVARESKSAKSRHLAFFSMDYKGKYWYWELIELTRKLLLNGFVVLCNQGTILQLPIALVIVMLHMILVLRTKPMRYKSNNAFFSYTK